MEDHIHLSPISFEESRKKKVRLDMEEIQQQIANQPTKPLSLVNIDMVNYNTNMDDFLNKFSDIDSLDDTKLGELLQRYYLSILEASNVIRERKKCGLDIRVDPQYDIIIKIFTMPRCIMIFHNIINKYGLPTYYHKIYLNSIIYDYIVRDDKNSMVEKLLLELAIMTNPQIIYNLSDAIPDRLCALLSVCKYSSLDGSLCIRRLNRMLFSFGKASVLTSTRIVSIYEKLYGGEMTKLFESVMFDVYSPEVLNNATDDQREIYSYIGLAALELLHVMPTASIYSILNSYYWDYINNNCPPVRFTMRFLSDDFHRINQAIAMLANEGKYIV